MPVEIGSSVEAPSYCRRCGGRARRSGLVRLLISTVLRKPWSIFVEETDRARSATRQLCHCFIQDSSTTGSANHSREVSFLSPRVFALRVWSVAVRARTVCSCWMLDADRYGTLGVTRHFFNSFHVLSFVSFLQFLHFLHFLQFLQFLQFLKFLQVLQFLHFFAFFCIFCIFSMFFIYVQTTITVFYSVSQFNFVDCAR